MKTYIIMKEKQSAICSYPSIPHLVVGSLKEARKLCDELEAKATQNMYWYESVKNTLK